MHLLALAHLLGAASSRGRCNGGVESRGGLALQRQQWLHFERTLMPQVIILGAPSLLAFDIKEAVPEADTVTHHVTPLRLRRDALMRELFHRFLRHLWGAEVALLLVRNLQLQLTLPELAYVVQQNHRIFARMPTSLRSPAQVARYAWRYGGMVLYLAVRFRDPYLLINWMQQRLTHVSLFQHRRFFRTLALTLRGAVTTPTLAWRLRGLRLQVTGKLSVTGNAMSRTYFVRAGSQGNANLSLHLAQGFTLVRTHTGCLGVWLGFYF